MDEGFTDPVVRCDSCQGLLRREILHKHGRCIKCGNRRIRNLTVLSESETKQMEEWGFSDFLKKFEIVSETEEVAHE